MKKDFLRKIILTSTTFFVISVPGVFSSFAAPETTPVTIKNKEGLPVISYKNSRALIIWVGKYKYWPKLDHVEEEAKQVKKSLEQQGFLVEMKEGSTAQDIRSSMDTFTAEYAYRDDIDRVVIFLTGHGLSRHKKGFFIAADSPSPKFSEEMGRDTEFYKKTVPMEKFYDDVSNSFTTKHILVVLDTCFSGSIFRNRPSNKPNLDLSSDSSLKLLQNPSRQVLTAGSDKEEVPTKSIFTPMFIDALKGDADLNNDGIVTGSEIANYLMKKVPANSPSSRPQTPQYAIIPVSTAQNEIPGDIAFGQVELVHYFSGSGTRLPDLALSELPDLALSDTVSKRRSSYTVEYFGKGKVNDSNHVENVLHKLGFVKAKLPSQNKTLISDSIWVGGKVDIKDVKVLAYTLIQDGVKLKSIRTFKKTKRHPNPEELKLIQIGADKDIRSNCKPLTIQQIQTATEIDRTTLVCGN